MTDYQQIVLALLIWILCRTFMPPLGANTPSNKATILLTSLGCSLWIGVAMAHMLAR